MTVSSQLTADLRKLVLRLEDDLRERLAQDEENLSRWKAEHQGALDAQRTSSAWQAWRDDKITQAAVAWILTTVFVRFAEDNALVRPVWISGPGARRQEALDAQIVFFRDHPELTDREWLLEPVEYLKKLPATADLVGEHSALWQVQPSGRMATEILEFWRQTDDAGLPSFDLADPELSTRFLGDLYQDLSDYAKKTFALLQTPEFVEEFILDQTLTPALAERPLEGFKLIDPTCGSGHFLLGAFARLTDAWAHNAPGLDGRARVQKALDAVHGVDLNPFAVAIARFRLTVAALKACNETSLELAPAFNFHVAAGDSLLHGQVQREFQFEGFDADSKLSGFSYAAEDLDQLKDILRPGQYDVVVGNPPYITVKDKTLNEAYRRRYTTCKGKYALTVPFMERFFGLARYASDHAPAGWTGQITSNSFMKREFGSKLIEDFLSLQDLRLVADTSGAYIPGHGTPTVIIVGRHQRPVGTIVRTVLGIRGEAKRPDDPAQGSVWKSVVSGAQGLSVEDGWTSVSDLDRTTLSKHPWSLSGAGALELRTHLDEFPLKLRQVGRTYVGVVTGEDELLLRQIPEAAWQQGGAALRYVHGEVVRDWKSTFTKRALADLKPDWANRHLWKWRHILKSGVFFGGTREERGLNWWDPAFSQKNIANATVTVSWPEVSSHNHFSIYRGRYGFDKTAPVIVFNEDLGPSASVGVVGLLNSSTIGFWMKQVSFNKGGDRVGVEGARISKSPWEDRFAFNGSSLQELPIAPKLPSQRAERIYSLAHDLDEIDSRLMSSNWVPTAQELDDLRALHASIRSAMISLQEELDWEVYACFGLTDSDLSYCSEDLPNISLGERAFEIAMARQMRAGSLDTAWFSRHGSRPASELPDHWPRAYAEVIDRRLALIESNDFVRLLEAPEHKRRWAAEPWDRRQERALRVWLLDRLEDRSLWFDRQGRPVARSVSQLADTVSRDNDFLSVLSLWHGSRDVDVVSVLTQLLIDEAVPYLTAQRLKEPGLRKHEAWEATWELQRREDAGQDVGSIPVPPKYTSADFRKASWWQARGKLDVPKERFILYPDAGRSTDQTLLLGWAGWNHVEQFLALAAVMDQLVADGAPDEQLIPLVAGLVEILPWVKQWHADIDPAYGVSMADFCAQQFEERAAQIDRSHDQLKAWRPTTPSRSRRTKVTQ
jgi:hypothetical protein